MHLKVSEALIEVRIDRQQCICFCNSQVVKDNVTSAFLKFKATK